MKQHLIALAAILLFVRFPLFAQGSESGGSLENLQMGGIIHSDNPASIFEEWRLGLKNGDVVVTDRSSLSVRNQTLFINGDLRTMNVPTSDITGVTIFPSKHRFRTAFVGSLFWSSMLLFSPINTPGYYIGTKKSYRSGYYYYPTNYSSSQDAEYDLPGLSVYSVIFAVGSSLVAGVISRMLEDDPNMILLDGKESDAAWNSLLSGSQSKFRLHGSASYVLTSALSDWKKSMEKYEIYDQSLSQYEAALTRPEMTQINMGRLIRLGYAFDPSWEIGIGYQADGIQRFYQNFKYVRPGTPPQTYIRELSQSCRTDAFYLTAQYTLAEIKPLKTLVSAGLGVGTNSTKITTYGYNPSVSSLTPLNKSALAYTIFSSAEYMLDRSLSCGITLDYTDAGSYEIPSMNIIDYDNRVIQPIDKYQLKLKSFGAGLSITLNL